MWKNLALLPRTSYSLLWSVPIWLFLEIQDKDWFPSGFVDWLLIVCFSFVFEYLLIHRWLKSQNSPGSRRAILRTISYVCLMLILFILVLLLFLVTLTSTTEEINLKAALAQMYLLIATFHTACMCARYTFGRYGSI